MRSTAAGSSGCSSATRSRSAPSSAVGGGVTSLFAFQRSASGEAFRQFCTLVYVMRRALRINPSATRYPRTSPRGSISITQLRTKRSSWGSREQMPLESSCGNMGTARSGKYTLVPRTRASVSKADPAST